MQTATQTSCSSKRTAPGKASVMKMCSEVVSKGLKVPPPPRGISSSVPFAKLGNRRRKESFLRGLYLVGVSGGSTASTDRDCLTIAGVEYRAGTLEVVASSTDCDCRKVAGVVYRAGTLEVTTASSFFSKEVPASSGLSVKLTVSLGPSATPISSSGCDCWDVMDLSLLICDVTRVENLLNLVRF